MEQAKEMLVKKCTDDLPWLAGIDATGQESSGFRRKSLQVHHRTGKMGGIRINKVGQHPGKKTDTGVMKLFADGEAAEMIAKTHDPAIGGIGEIEEQVHTAVGCYAVVKIFCKWLTGLQIPVAVNKRLKARMGLELAVPYSRVCRPCGRLQRSIPFPYL